MLSRSAGAPVPLRIRRSGCAVSANLLELLAEGSCTARYGVFGPRVRGLKPAEQVEYLVPSAAVGPQSFRGHGKQGMGYAPFEFYEAM